METLKNMSIQWILPIPRFYVESRSKNCHPPRSQMTMLPWQTPPLARRKNSWSTTSRKPTRWKDWSWWVMGDAQNTSNQPSKPTCHNKFMGCEGYQASLIGQIKDSMIPIKSQGSADRCKSCPTQYKIIRGEITTIKHTGFQHATEANQHGHTGPNNNINNQLQWPLLRERDTWGSSLILLSGVHSRNLQTFIHRVAI